MCKDNKYYITESESTSLVDFIEFYFIESIRVDESVDNIEYLRNIANVYYRLKNNLRNESEG